MKGYYVLDSNTMSWLKTADGGKLRDLTPYVSDATRFTSYWAAEKACKLMNEFPVYVEPDTLIGRVMVAIKMRKIRKANRLRAEESRRRR
jgi:hypothetical protein